MDFFTVVIDKAISVVDERFDSLQVHHNSFGFLHGIKNLNEMARNELMAKSQNLGKNYNILIVMI